MTNICTKAAQVFNEKGKEGFLDFVRQNCSLNEIDVLHEILDIDFELQGGNIVDIDGGFVSDRMSNEQRTYVALGGDKQLERAGWYIH